MYFRQSQDLSNSISLSQVLLMSYLQPTKQKTNSKNLWFERLMAIAATVNLGLVLFDYSYIPWRDFYLRHQFPASTRMPTITDLYDPIKDIEPYRDTSNYLDTVDTLETQVGITGVQSPQVETLLAQLRGQSAEMIQSNWFDVANKRGTLEKIKDRMRNHLYPRSYRGKKSATQAFETFWSQKYLTQSGWKQEISFFDIRIRPLITTNYFRHIGENGQPIDLFFWRIDIWFFSLFALEFLARTYYISRSHNGLSWIDAMLWRWYDIFLLLPFWRWLRVIPVLLRLDRAELLSLDQIQKQVNQGLVASFATELTQVVVLRVINQIQSSVQRGEVTKFLQHHEKLPEASSGVEDFPRHRNAIQLSNVNEVEAIANLLVQLTVYQVLPKIQPDVEAILRHNMEGILNQLPLYSSLQNFPGAGNLPAQLTEQLAAQIAQTAYDAIIAGIEDPVGAKLSSQLIQHFSEALGSEVQKKQTIKQIQDLLWELLEKVKSNYINSSTEEDVEKALEEARRLRSIEQR